VFDNNSRSVTQEVGMANTVWQSATQLDDALGSLREDFVESY
jgi:hypothetical protein